MYTILYIIQVVSPAVYITVSIYYSTIIGIACYIGLRQRQAHMFINEKEHYIHSQTSNTTLHDIIMSAPESYWSAVTKIERY